MDDGRLLVLLAAGLAAAGAAVRGSRGIVRRRNQPNPNRAIFIDGTHGFVVFDPDKLTVPWIGSEGDRGTGDDPAVLLTYRDETWSERPVRILAWDHHYGSARLQVRVPTITRPLSIDGTVLTYEQILELGYDPQGLFEEVAWEVTV